MLITEKLPEGYLDSVRAFADKVNARKDFEDRLDYLRTWGESDGVHRCDVYLYSDHSPFSFEFQIVRIERAFKEYAHICTVCKHVYWSEQTKQWDQCYEYECQAIGKMLLLPDEFCRERSVTRANDMNGGLIYFGPGDTGVSGPQFSVRSEGPARKHEWSIHT